MITIKLKSNGTGRYDDVSPVIITDRKLLLKIALPNVNGDFYFVAENNGATIKRLLSENGEVALEKLSAGELNAEVKHYLKGTLIKTYKIEPLLLIEADGDVSAEPEFSALDRRICSVESDLNVFKKANKERAEAQNAVIARATKNLAALIRFALKAYGASPFLGGGTADKFAEEFGFVLAAEEINQIKGETDND